MRRGERVVGLGLVFENDGRMVMVLYVSSHGGDLEVVLLFCLRLTDGEERG